MEQQILTFRYAGTIHLNMDNIETSLLADVTVLPVKLHRVQTIVTGNLQHVQTGFDFLIRLDSHVHGDRVAGHIAAQHAIHIVLLKGCDIQITVEPFLHCLSNQLAQLFLSFVVFTALVDSTLANRHSEIQIVGQRSGTFDSSFSVQFVRERSRVYVLEIITDIGYTYAIPVLLVVARNRVSHIRNKQRSTILSRINRLRSILAGHFRREYECVGRCDSEIYFYITQAVDHLCRE